MKKNLLIRAFAMVLAVLLIGSAAGCKNDSSDSSSDEVEIIYRYEDGDTVASGDNVTASGNEDTSGASQAGTTGSSGASSQTGKIEVVNNCYTAGEKIAKDPITFKIMIRDHGAGMAKYDDSSFAKYVKEKYNITLKFEVCSEGVFQEKMILAYSSNKLPDMFWGMAPATELHNPYIKKGQVKAIGDIIDKYAPNIQKMYKENPSAKYISTFDDGKRYMIPMVNNNDKYGAMLFINNTWLKKLKLNMPTTYDELYNVLKAFKTKDPNGNKKNDEIPMMIAGTINPSLYGPFGANFYLNGMSLDANTGKIFYGYTSEAYRNGLRYFNKLFKEGLLDNNLKGTSSADIYERSSGATQTVGVFAAESYSGYVSDESFLNNYVIMPLLKVDGTTPQYFYNTFENDWAEWCLVTSACKYPECAVRLVDKFYSTEGALLAREGAPGKNNAWNVDSNGKISVSISNKPSKYKTLSEWYYSMTPGYAIPHYASKEFYDIVNSASASQSKALKYELDQKKAIYSKVDTTKSLPKLYYTDKQIAEKDKLPGGTSKLSDDMFWKFLSGTANLDNEWDAYVTQMNKLGITKQVEIAQAAYNSYKVWLQKNG